MPQFYVIAGKKQSGKTTAANYIESRTDLAKVVSFADPIKDFCKNVLGLTRAQIYGTEEEKNSPTDVMWDKMPADIRLRYDPLPIPPKCGTCGHQEFYLTGGIHFGKTGHMTAREVMQVFGTDMIRTYFGYDTWAQIPFNKYHDTLHRCIIIDDCRFHNEANLALDHNACLIRLTRDVLGPDQHVSETALDNYPTDKYTHVIDNQDLTIEETQVILKDILDGTTK